MIADTARKIGTAFGLDYWRAKDKDKSFPSEIWSAICDAGLCGVAIPAEYGGGGLGMFDMALVVENLAAGGAGCTLAQLFMITPIFGGIAISRFGSRAHEKKFSSPGSSRGEMHCCMALTEPDAGSNSLAIRSFASPEGSGWRLNGRKIWITGVDAAAKMLVVARTQKLEDVRKKTEGISLFLVDTERTGISHQPIEKLGTNTLTSSNVYFENVRVEPEELLGTLHGGWAELLDVLNTERIVTVAGLVGTVDLAIRIAVPYAESRRIFAGRPIGSYQALQFPLAQSHAESECARLMNYKAAWLFDSGLPYGSQANVAKLIAAQACSAATEHAMQTLGGTGYSKDAHLERLWRDCRLFRFAPVSEEMTLNFIAQHDLGMPRSY